jgi:sporulation protein YlmC with PRC-barrel domain
MFNKMLMAAMASTIIVSAPLMAAPGGGGGGGHGGGGGGHGASAGGNSGAGGGGGGPAAAALDARMNSMGLENASPTGIDHASPNSALGTSTTTTVRTNTSAGMDRMFPGTNATTSIRSGSLTGLSTGMTLTSNGTNVGTVQQIRTSTDGSVRVVVVQGANGRMFAIPATKLALNNGTLTTTARLSGINGGTAFTNPATGHSQGPMHASPTGIAHASSHSVLAGGAVASSVLPGLTAGLAVHSSTGTNLGTVSQVVTDSSGNVRLVIVTSPTGQTLRLAPTTLTMSGNTVVTSTM